MAINEACQVWIEQRVQEELAERNSSGKSLRQIGRELAAEIEKVFEAKVNPRSLEKKAERIGATNVAPQEQPTNQEVKVETVETLDPPKIKMTKEEVVVEIDIMVDQGMSIREASKVLARKLGRSVHGVRRTYCKVKEEQNNKCHATFAWQFAEIAIMQLSRINKDDPDRIAAYARVKDWISKQEEN